MVFGLSQTKKSVAAELVMGLTRIWQNGYSNTYLALAPLPPRAYMKSFDRCMYILVSPIRLYWIDWVEFNTP